MQSFYVKQLQRSTSISSSGGNPAPSAEYPSHERIEKVVALPRISHGRGVSKQPIVVVTADFRSAARFPPRPPAVPNPPQALCTRKCTI